jgi:3D (Asp-Asp-Asp) domain-containing protein
VSLLPAGSQNPLYSTADPETETRVPRFAFRIVLLLLAGPLLLLSSGCASIRPPMGARATERVLLTTAYCDCGKCCSWKRNWFFQPVYAVGPRKGQRKIVGVTASGAEARQGTLAADTTRFPFGTIMFIRGYGYGRVEDRGGAIQGDHIDLFFSSHSRALEWGRRRLPVKIWFPRR